MLTVLEKGRPGESYNIGAANERRNADIVERLCALLDELAPAARNASIGGKIKRYNELVTFVKDRPGHDRRYAIDFTKLTRELGWKPAHDLGAGLRDTVRWYLDNPAWIEHVRTGAYREWMATNYDRR